MLAWLADRLLGRPRVIRDRVGRSPYLSRYYVFGRYSMADGSWPFDECGGPRPDAIKPRLPWGLYLHCFHRSDDASDLHSHPWKWAVSLILSGGYVEERYVDRSTIRVKRFSPGALNVIRSDDFHRVDLMKGRDCWSLFFVGPRFSGWGFRLRDTGEFLSHGQYLSRARRPQDDDLDELTERKA